MMHITCIHTDYVWILDPFRRSFIDLIRQFLRESITRRDGQTRTIELIVFGQNITGLRTVGSLYEDRNNVMTGRMPRVWLVDEVDFTQREANLIGPHRVLKDV